MFPKILLARNLVTWCFFLLCLMAGSTPALAQRCGDHIWINLKTPKGETIQPVEFDSVKIQTFDNYTTGGKVQEMEPILLEVPPGTKSYSVRTGCGLEWMLFEFTYKGEKMTIRLRHIPGDAENCLLNGYVFRKGEFEADFGKTSDRWEKGPKIQIPYPYSQEYYLFKQEKLVLVKKTSEAPKRSGKG